MKASFSSIPRSSLTKLNFIFLNFRSSSTTNTGTRPESSASLSSLFNAFDEVINEFVDPPLKQSVDPNYVLSNNFAPLRSELPPTECEIIHGSLPSCLDGAYIRNGPNAQHLPSGPYHIFDGDGMLHAIRISNGRATLCSRYVKTYKYLKEREAGHPIITSIFSGFHGLVASTARTTVSLARMLATQYNPASGVGVANTSLNLMGGHLYAQCEYDMPYRIRVTKGGDIETLGRHDFDGKLSMSMTAHPKMDPETGEVFAFKYGPVPPFLSFFRIDANGRKQASVPIFSMTRPSFIHDIAITKRYMMIVDIQITMKPLDVIVGGGRPVGLDPSKVPRLGVIPRYATSGSEIRWFDVPGFNIIHVVNAWEEDDGDTLVLVASNMVSAEHTMERLELTHMSLEKLKVDLRKGVVWRYPLSTRCLDFAVINQGYVGKKNKFAYSAVGDPAPKVPGVVKLDISKGEHNESTVASRMYGPGCYGGEPFFVPKGEPDEDEDNGYVVTYMHDDNKGESKFLVMDAKSPSLELVAAVKLPSRVPHGFHGLFVGEKNLTTL